MKNQDAMKLSVTCLAGELVEKEKGRGGRSGRGGHGGRTAGGGGRGAGREAVHTAAVQVEQQTGTYDTASDAAQVSIPGLSPDQVQRLLSLINIPKSGYEKLSDKPSWMIDSGASCHMTHDSKLIR